MIPSLLAETEGPLAADVVVVRIVWNSRRHALLHPAPLLRDRLLGIAIPEVGCNIKSAILGCAPALFTVVRRVPDGIPVVGASDTRVVILPAMPPRLESDLNAHASIWRPVFDAVNCCMHPSLSLTDIGLPRPRLILVTGPNGAGKTSAVAAAARDTGAELIRVTSSDVLRRSVTKTGIWAALRHDLDIAMAAAPALLLIDDVHFLFPPIHDGRFDDNDALSALARLADQLYLVDCNVCVVLVGSPGLFAVDTAVARLSDLTIELGNLSTREEGLWAVRTAFQRMGRVDGLESISIDDILVQLALGMTIGAVLDAASSVDAAEALSCSETKQILSRCLKEIARSNSVSSSAGRVKVVHPSSPSAKRGDVDAARDMLSLNVAGVDEAVATLSEAIACAVTRRHVYERLGVRPAAGVLLYGPPGTGKTLVVREVAAMCNVSLLAVDAATLARGEVGESERILQAVYDKATALAPAVVFLDEIDALFSGASSSGRGGDIDTQSSSCLGRLAHGLIRALDAGSSASHSVGSSSRLGCGVVTIGATNRPWCVPRAVLRAGRLERCVHMGLLSAADRASVVAKLLSQLRGNQNQQEQKLQNGTRDETVFQLCEWAASDAARGASGADLAGACRRAALQVTASFANENGIDGSRDGIFGGCDGFGRTVITANAIARAYGEMGPSVAPEDARAIVEWRPPL
jgi:AAA family ATPase